VHPTGIITSHLALNHWSTYTIMYIKVVQHNLYYISHTACPQKCQNGGNHSTSKDARLATHKKPWKIMRFINTKTLSI
jgi:hypothetical protein